MYERPLRNGNWASTALWGRTRSLQDNSKENSYLLESTLRFATRNYVWTRMENAGRTNELLNGEKPLPPGFVEEPIGHVAAYTFGYDRDFEFDSACADGFWGADYVSMGFLRFCRRTMGVIRWGGLCLCGSGLIRGMSGRVLRGYPPPPLFCANSSK